MKKKILPLILLTLLIVFTLVACNNEASSLPQENHTSYDAFTFYPQSSDTYVVEIAPEGKYYTEIVIPSTYNGGTVVEILEEGFKDCESLQTITIPNTIQKIGEAAFENCYDLSTINFTNSVTEIGNNAFWGCRISTVYFEGDLQDWLYIYFADLWDNGTSNPLHSGADLYLNNELLTELVADDSMERTDRIAENFNGCTSLKKVVIPEDAVTIGPRAFDNCHNLENVIISEGIDAIEEYAFSGCYSLKSITIPNSVTEIGEFAFRSCTALENITFSEDISLTQIGEYAFSNCESLKNIIIPNSVRSIGEFAFDSCVSLENITLPNGITEINNRTFQACTSLKDITLPFGITRIGIAAFRDCTALESITIFLVLYINDNAFENCTSLKKIDYQGDKFMWNYTVKKGETWDKATGNYTIYCTDGNIEK